MGTSSLVSASSRPPSGTLPWKLDTDQLQSANKGEEVRCQKHLEMNLSMVGLRRPQPPLVSWPEDLLKKKSTVVLQVGAWAKANVSESLGNCEGQALYGVFMLAWPSAMQGPGRRPSGKVRRDWCFGVQH